MAYMRNCPLDRKVYVGDLANGVPSNELETIFAKYGLLRNVWVAKNPPGFAFVEFEDPRDAEDAVRALDGTKIGGQRVRVEFSHGRSKNKDREKENGSRRPPPSYRDSRDSRRSPPPRRRRYSRSPSSTRGRSRSSSRRRDRY